MSETLEEELDNNECYKGLAKCLYGIMAHFLKQRFA